MLYASNQYNTFEELKDRKRIEEIARMLSGVELTDAALSNARELLRK